MFYKLKTDLPTLKAGDLFYLDQNGNLCHKETGIIEYHYITLEKFPDALEKFWEPVEEEYKRWRAKNGEPYFYVDECVKVIPSSEEHDSVDGDCYRYGNYFQTREEAQALADYLKALAVVRDDAKGFVPDWSDNEQEKWHVADVDGGLLAIYTVRTVEAGIFGLPYFQSKADAEVSITKHTAEWLTIFGVKDETGADDE